MIKAKPALQASGIRATSAVAANSDHIVRRSTLIVPAHVQRFVRGAAKAGADAVMLDLEDGVAPSQKDAARAAMADAVASLRSHIKTIIVRVNNDSFEQMITDLQVAFRARPDGIFIPKIESLEEAVRCDAVLASKEVEAALPVGSIEMPLSLETPRGLLEFKDICGAAIPRIRTVAFGSEDIALELGIKATDEGQERLVGNSLIVMAAAAHRLQPLGLLGDLTNFRDLAKLEAAARRSFAFGLMGSYCIHPSQVPVLNKAFSPALEEVEYARAVLETASARDGQAGHVDGTMVAASAYRRAERLMRRVEAIDAHSCRPE